jgi:hypothetical protein
MLCVLPTGIHLYSCLQQNKPLLVASKEPNCSSFYATIAMNCLMMSSKRNLPKSSRDSTVGQCPVPPAQLALALILQAYTGISDDEVIEVLMMDRRWQLVIDCHDCHKPPFSKGTFVQFRKVLIDKGLDQRLVERTVEIAKKRGGFSSGRLRAALDSSPLWGAAKVEDTYNLLGHTLKKALRVMADAQECALADVAARTGTQLLVGSSLKAALDLNWDDPTERKQALEVILNTLDTVESVRFV